MTRINKARGVQEDTCRRRIGGRDDEYYNIKNKDLKEKMLIDVIKKKMTKIVHTCK